MRPARSEVLVPPAAPGDRRADAEVPRLRTAGRGPAFALGAVVLVGAVVYGIAAQLVPMPLVNPDELDYTLAARALADGHWLSVRGEGYGFGPVYPIVLAALVALAGSVAAAYPLFKAANALLFALAAVPVYFLARRLLSPWWSVGVAALSLVIPSSIYASLVMTESTSYLVFSVALLAVVLALERPSVVRQLAMLAAVALAYASRAQFAALLPACLAAFAVLWAVGPRRPGLRDAVVRLWPTLGAVVLGMAALAGRLVLTSSSPAGLLNGYGVLWRDYDLGSVARFVAYHLAAWEIYLFVVPFVVMPIVVAELLRDARRGGTREGAFVAAFLTVNAAMLVVTAAFATTPFGYSELHDRYLFYVAPLWFLGFAVWLSRGLPRPLVWTAVGVALALVLPAILPFGLIGGNIVFEEVPTALWSWVWTAVESTPHLDGRRVLRLTVIALTVAAVAVPRRFWPVLPLVVAAGLMLSSGHAWQREADVPVEFTVADVGSRTWVDDALPAGARVTKLYVSPPACPYSEQTRHALFLTELFNSSVDRVATIGDSVSDGLAADRVDVGAGGRLVLAGGAPFTADYVVTQPQIRLDARRVATGAGDYLVLWKTDGPVRLADRSLRTDDVLAAFCR